MPLSFSHRPCGENVGKVQPRGIAAEGSACQFHRHCVHGGVDDPGACLRDDPYTVLHISSGRMHSTVCRIPGW